MAQAVTVPAARDAGLKMVDAATLKGWLDRGEAVLVDVREPAEHAAAHIPGSQSMPLSAFDCAAVQPKDGRKLVLHCQSGMRAGQAAKRLLDAGCGEVYCFESGVAGWQQAGHAVEVSGRARLSVLRQTQLTVGAGVFLGTLLGVLVSPWFLILPAFMGCGLILAGSTGYCPLAGGIARLPHNQGSGCR